MHDQNSHPAILLNVRFKTKLPFEEMERRYKERLPLFREFKGLLQKYYQFDQKTGEWGGLYLWDSKDSLQAYLDSDLRKTIPEAYEVEGTPSVQLTEVIDVLRPERP